MAARWPFRLHATYDESITRFLNVIEAVNRRTPLNGLRWWLDHCETISPGNLVRVKALGGGIAIQHRLAYQGEHFHDRYQQLAQHAPPFSAIRDAGLRRRYNADILTLTSTVLMAGLLLALATLASPMIIGACMLVGGGAWIAQMSGLNVAAQFATASWVRGRALAMYAVVFQGAMFVGTTTWGSIASWWTTPLALLAAASVLLASMVLAIRYRLAPTEKMDLTPSMHWPRPQLTIDSAQEDLPAFVSVEYEVEPNDHAAFMAAMQEVRRMRLRDGASSWGVFHEPEAPRILLECFQVPSWAEHMRQHDRITKQDLASEETVRRFHRGTAPPVVRHYVAPRT